MAAFSPSTLIRQQLGVSSIKRMAWSHELREREHEEMRERLSELTETVDMLAQRVSDTEEAIERGRERYGRLKHRYEHMSRELRSIRDEQIAMLKDQAGRWEEDDTSSDVADKGPTTVVAHPGRT